VKGQQLMDLKPPGFAWLCLALLGFAWLCLALLGFAWFRLVSLNDTPPVYLGD